MDSTSSKFVSLQRNRGRGRQLTRGPVKNAGMGGLALGLGILASVPVAMASSESVIYSFPYQSGSVARPYQDPTGAVYATAYSGSNTGTAFKIVEDHGTWKGRKIFNFKGNGGENPVAGVISDANGVLYGTTQNGGTYGRGTVYSLAQINKVWTETVLHNFSGGADGGLPAINLVRDKSTGALYGTTPSGGGNSNCGTAFSLVPSGNSWTFNTLYSFAGGTDGCGPVAGLREGLKTGTFFSITGSGGAKNAGTVFELAEAGGVWSESTVYSFTGGNDGYMPADIGIDDTGRMFGVTRGGGVHGWGVVFQVRAFHNKWSQSVLYSFYGGSYGGTAIGIHLEKGSKTLYGTTASGGSDGYGTLFRLDKHGSYWSQTVAHSFGTSQSDGRYPESRPVEDAATGIIYGTTSQGGAYNGGALYWYIP
jgi:uncharacterized repeat protein (TIGR03803 family)